MDHLDAATERVSSFQQKNSTCLTTVLVVAGDFKTEKAKQWIKTLVISKGPAIERPAFPEEPITHIKATFEDPNIQIPMIVAAYRTASMKIATQSFRLYLYHIKRW
jgi:predicted Zn-dependent peptidase